MGKHKEKFKIKRKNIYTKRSRKKGKKVEAIKLA
jgi:hypothetical protein